LTYPPAAFALRCTMQDQKSAATVPWLIVSEKGMAKSRRGTVRATVWLKCFRGVAETPQSFAVY
jgi:hypothetical protein